MIDEYTAALSSPFDSFLEDHILASQFYTVHTNDQEIGYFAIKDSELLTQFYLKQPAQKHSRAMLAEIVERSGAKTAFVPTCDELFLSAVLDSDCKIDKQAYFFQDGGGTPDPGDLYANGIFRPAVGTDAERLAEVSGDFLDRREQRIDNGEIFLLEDQHCLLGVGVMERSRMLPGYASIGMFTNEQYRQRGIGRTVISHLKNRCYAHGLTPICGCWYYNTLSKRTLEAAGMVTKTRLLNVGLVRPEAALKEDRNDTQENV